ncbi:hypothetical protein MBLNU457_6179t1 [Dothideomycetes sp. NU457]
MSQQSGSEAFPMLSPDAPSTTTQRVTRANGAPKFRRKSSSLGGDPRGDTGAMAFATMASTPEGKDHAASQSKPHSKRKKARSLFRRCVRYSLKHTWLLPLVILLTVLAAYGVNPGPQNPLHACIFLSYPKPRAADAAPDAPTMYGKGAKDFQFVAFYVVFFTFTREFLMQRVIRPLAIRWGIEKRAKQSRFMEQFYTAVYFGIFGPFGLYVMSRTPVWYFNTTGMMEGFPHRTHEAAFKAYYLLQGSYWAQQGIVLVLLLEKPRKDFKELVLHHLVTLTLIWCSYRFHFTYMGIAVYITHDISDFFLATSKVLNYLDSPIVAPYFAMFIGVWIYLRHYINLRIIWMVLTTFATVGPFELNWDTEQYKCWISQYITFGLLASLQAVNLFWLFLILRIAWRIVASSVIADERSDDEDASEDEQREKVLESRDKQTPAVLLNGAPVEDDDHDMVAIPAEPEKELATRRSPRRRG